MWRRATVLVQPPLEQGHLQETGCGADLKSGLLSQSRMKAVFCLFVEAMKCILYLLHVKAFKNVSVAFVFSLMYDAFSLSCASYSHISLQYLTT